MVSLYQGDAELQVTILPYLLVKKTEKAKNLCNNTQPAGRLPEGGVHPGPDNQQAGGALRRHHGRHHHGRRLWHLCQRKVLEEKGLAWEKIWFEGTAWPPREQLWRCLSAALVLFLMLELLTSWVGFHHYNEFLGGFIISSLES